MCVDPASTSRVARPHSGLLLTVFATAACAGTAGSSSGGAAESSSGSAAGPPTSGSSAGGALAGTEGMPAAGACYDATVGAWALDPGPTGTAPAGPSPDAGGDSLIHAFPPRIVLVPDIVEEGVMEGRLRLAVPDGALPVPLPYQSWSRSGDSLDIDLGTGFAGSNSGLTGGDDSWTGTLTATSDVGGRGTWTRPIRLDRVACGSPPPVPASAVRPLLRSVELEGGGRITLGQPLPSDIATTKRNGPRTFGLDVRTTGLAAGADTVVVVLDRDDRVQRITLRWTSWDGAETLADRVRAAWGPETSSVVGPGAMVSWNGRTTDVFVRLRPGSTQLSLSDPRVSRY